MHRFLFRKASVFDSIVYFSWDLVSLRTLSYWDKPNILDKPRPSNGLDGAELSTILRIRASFTVSRAQNRYFSSSFNLLLSKLASFSGCSNIVSFATYSTCWTLSVFICSTYWFLIISIEILVSSVNMISLSIYCEEIGYISNESTLRYVESELTASKP